MTQSNKKDDTVKTNTERIEFQIPIITNSHYDLSKFDFSFVGIKLYNIESDEFKEYIEQNHEWLKHSYKLFLQIFDEDTFPRKQRYAIVKDKYDYTFNREDIYNVIRLLKIVFPCNLKIERIFNFKIIDSIVYRNIECFGIEYNDPDFFLESKNEQLQEINEFFKLVFNRSKVKSFIELTIISYLQSFNITHRQFQFISLCICLETVIYGKNELSYRIARSVAILCGKNKSNSELIYKNTKKIYDLRSKIVHGEFDESFEQNRKTLNDYIVYLQYLVSRMIIELLIHNVNDKQELDKKITPLGFGQRSEISTNWKYFLLNPFNRVTEYEIEKSRNHIFMIK